MNPNPDLERLALQEERLQFDHFGNDRAWALGLALKAMAEARGVSVAIEIRLARETVFFYAMPGTAPTNADWARRKRNSVELLHRSSYRIGLELQRDGGTLEDRMGLPLRDHASHGGAFPLRLAGTGCVGCVTVSGLPQRDDHAMVVEALAAMAGLPLAGLALD